MGIGIVDAVGIEVDVKYRRLFYYFFNIALGSRRSLWKFI